MQKLTFYKKIHFIGILGVSMQNLARFSMSFNIGVSGSDDAFCGEKPWFLSDVTIKKAFVAEEFKDVDLVVYSGAITDTHPDMILSRKLNIEMVRRDEFLAKLLEEFDISICVAGSHGKTSTSSMIAEILKVANLRPALHIGGEYGNFFPFSNRYVVSEACEYKRSFLALSPTISVILNTEYDHPDCYATREELREAYLRFARRTKAHGVLISPFYIPNGTENIVIGQDVYAKNIQNDGEYFSFTPVVNGVEKERITLSVPGLHNVQNALFSIAVANHLKVDYKYVKSGLESFLGAKLRYTKKTTPYGDIIVDYAHHPTEIKAVIDTAKLNSHAIRVLFQPHTYSRTKAFYDEFVSVLSACSPLYIVEEYPARETPDMGIDAYQLYLGLRDKTKAYYLTLPEIKGLLNTPYPTTLILGAGNISQII